VGTIRTSTTDRFGVKTETEVRTSQFEDFVLNTIYKVFGRNRGWQAAHFIEKRKLRNSK